MNGDETEVVDIASLLRQKLVKPLANVIIDRLVDAIEDLTKAKN